MADDFSRLVSLACHDLRTPLATVQGFAKTMLRMDELDDEKRDRYLGLIDTAADELAQLLDQLSLAARIEGGRYDPSCARWTRSHSLPTARTGDRRDWSSVDPEPVERAIAALDRAAARHGGVETTVTVDGPRITIEPVTRRRGPIVLGETAKDLGAVVAVRLVQALGGEVALDGERLTVTLPS